MTPKQTITGGMIIGSAIGGYLPMLWGSGEISFASVFLAAIGGLVGIYIGYKITR